MAKKLPEGLLPESLAFAGRSDTNWKSVGLAGDATAIPTNLEDVFDIAKPVCF
jgi:hypothetical protein